MPQGRRKVAFSAKQKKVQLQQKRERKRHEGGQGTSDSHGNEGEERYVSESGQVLPEVPELSQPSARGGRKNSNRYGLLFKKESDEEIQRRRLEARRAFPFLMLEDLEVSYEDIYGSEMQLDMPKRPPWDFSFTKEQLEAKENKYFREYIQNLERICEDEDMSYFELNLETWRQLWRVLEMSDVVLLIADIRHPVLHFPPSLYNYVTQDLRKHIILVLNKIDLVPAPLVVAWMHYFKKRFPKLQLLSFSSYAGMKLARGNKGKRIGKLHMAAEGAKRLCDACEKLVPSHVDLSSWRQKIEEERAEADAVSAEEDTNPLAEADIHLVKADVSYYAEEMFKDGILTIGCVGHPNVGKSSLLNAIMGKKVVSVSRTPGHTKHFQTIYLTSTVRLCDCPGLVFPSKTPKPMQVLSGCFPIAQLREPYSTIRYLCERVPVPKLLKLNHPEQEGNNPSPELQWSAFDICEAWAEKRGFRTAKTARLDTYRAANHMLRMALDGRTLCLNFYPPGYVADKENWKRHPDVEEICLIQHNRTPDGDEDRGLEMGNDGSEGTDESEDDGGGDEDVASFPPNRFAVLEDSN